MSLRSSLNIPLANLLPRGKTMTWAALLGGTMLLASVATKADAFFGPVCIPRVQNCWCTFLRPCPVLDPGAIVTTRAWRETTNDQKKHTEEMATQFSNMSKGMACDAMGSVPGINAVGIDINAILRAQIPNINIDAIQTPGLESLRRQMQSLSLDAGMLQEVLGGEMTPEGFLRAAEAAGVNVNQLREMGVTLSSLQELAQGEPSSLMRMGLDRLGVDLGAAGMNPDSLRQLAAGQISVDTFLGNAQAAGVNTADLNRMGLGTDVLHNLSSGDLSGQGLPNVESVLNNTPRISIDANRIQQMLAGDMSPSNLLEMAERSGLSPSTLQTMGVSSQTIQSLRNGALSPQQLLEVSGALNFRQEALNSLGINEELLSNISSGRLPADALANVARGAGLNNLDLQGLGLDTAGINRMLQNGSSGLMATLQGAGLGNPILNGLNIDAGMLGRIASGELPAEAINDLLANSGLDPSAIVIPGVNGIITAANGAEALVNGPLNAVNDGLASLNSQITEMINIPIPAIPGLGNIIGGTCGSGVDPSDSLGGGLAGGADGSTNGTDPNATGQGPNATPQAGGGEGTGGGGGAGSTTGLAGGAGGAACMPNRPLITSTQPPSEFQPDVATIDFALAGNGDIFQQQEAISDALGEASRIYAGAVARAIVLRPLIPEALDSITAIESEMALIDTNGTLEEAWRMNSAIKTHVMSVGAEIASLNSYRATVEAAQHLNPSVYTALPIFPHDSAWEDDFNGTIRPEAQALIDSSQAALEATQAYNDFLYQAGVVNQAHESAVGYNATAALMPQVIETITFHETQKESLYYMETQLRAALDDLYHDPDAAWAILQQDLHANAGAYDNPNKWESGESVAEALSSSLTAQAPTTRYGRRILQRAEQVSNSSGGREVIPAVYSSTPRMPFSYPYVNERADSADEFQVAPPTTQRTSGDDSPPPPPPVMSGGIQTYLEAHRRERVWTPIRRGGDGTTTMSGAVWNELLDFAPGCLTGPIPTTASNLVARPELFDVAPSCNHLTWTDGDAEDYIQPTNLGGSDAILWQSKIDMDRALLQAGASDAQSLQPTIAARANQVAQMATQGNIQQQLEQSGYSAAARHVVEVQRMLQTIAADRTLQQNIPLPTIQP